MSEEKQGPEASPDGAGADSDPAAIALALGGASRARADDFLRDQQDLIQDQRHYLREQYKRLVEQVEETYLRLWELRLGVALRLGTLFIGVAAAAALGALAWNAAHAHGLVIESFSVPADLANRGISGQAVAAQVLDRLTDLQTDTDSSRPSRSYQNNWGDNIKVEIPETGISIGELRRFFYEWLGSDTHISGEVYRTGSGIAVTARASGYGSHTCTGPEAELDLCIRKAAEFIYGETQPYRYANYLDRNPNPQGRDQRVAQAAAIYRTLAGSPSAVERAWAWNGLATQVNAIQFDNRGAIPYLHKAMAAWPDFSVGVLALAFRERELGRDEQALADFRTAARLLHRDDVSDIDAAYVPLSRNSADSYIAALQGDFGEAARLSKAGAELPSRSFTLTRSNFQWRLLNALASLHDKKTVRAAMTSPDMKGLQSTVGQSLLLDSQMDDWNDVLTQQARIPKVIAMVSGPFPWVTAIVATARAHAGDLAGAQATIAPSPADCDDCLIARARIADWKGDFARADWWFARAEAQAPSIPFGDEAWGRALLARGRPDAAIEKFRLASGKGPHFADPLEGWGEALMAQNQSHLAVARFAQAEKYAPNWGRLHLKWGEALFYAGKPDEAAVQFAHAATLDLTVAEKSELADRRRARR